MERIIALSDLATMLTDDVLENNAKYDNLVTLYDDTSERQVIFAKRKNLVVLRGRTFSLELLFNSPIGALGVDSGQAYISDLNRKIICFGVGNGGTPSSDPFAPFAVLPKGIPGQKLANQIPFRIHDTTASPNDSQLFIPSTEISNYAGEVSLSVTRKQYMFKHFDIREPEWVYNSNENTVYKKIILKLTENDCRTLVSNQVNELGLFFGRQVGVLANGSADIRNLEMYSRITFPTEFLDVDKKLTFEYRVYA